MAADGGVSSGENDFSTNTAQSASQSVLVRDLFNNQTEQKAGLVAINITAPVIIGNGVATQDLQQTVTGAARNNTGSTVEGLGSPWPEINSGEPDESNDSE